MEQPHTMPDNATVPRLALRRSRPALRPLSRAAWLTLAELAVLLLWTVAFTSVYLNFQPHVIPAGREYELSVQSHYMWEHFRECGACAFWNGSTRGGAPATVDLYGAMLHPLVVITTLALGVTNGVKLALIAAFLMAGLAQWWLATVLGVGRLARLWSSMLVVVGGHLAGRMDYGLFGLVISAAACALVLPALILTLQTHSWRAATLLGMTLAAAATAGQAYLQFTLIFTLPAALVLVDWSQTTPLRVAKRLAYAAFIAVLLAAPFLVPFLHFFPQFGKPLNLDLVGVQPFAYVPLNLVISDMSFYKTNALGTIALDSPYQYTSYIGWVPVLLAGVGVYATRTPAQWRVTGFLLLALVLALWVSSGGVHHVALWLDNPALIDAVFGARIISLGIGIAIPLLLGLAALGLDYLFKRAWWHVSFLRGEPPNVQSTTISMRWVLLLPLLVALHSAWSTNSVFLRVVPRDPQLLQLLDYLDDTEGLEWVAPPFGEIYWIGPSIERGLKMSVGVRPWVWRDRPVPPPVIEADRVGVPEGFPPTPTATFGDIKIFHAEPGREYAAVVASDGERTPCVAQGRGGQISVQCAAPTAGVLEVRENRWSGWGAHVNGQRVPLVQVGQWLAVPVPAGSVQVELRYTAWDFYLGVLLMLGGLGLSGYVLMAGQPPDLLARLAPAGSTPLPES